MSRPSIDTDLWQSCAELLSYLVSTNQRADDHGQPFYWADVAVYAELEDVSARWVKNIASRAVEELKLNPGDMAWCHLHEWPEVANTASGDVVYVAVDAVRSFWQRAVA
ncbi:MAG: hypothetical protein ACR2LF_10785 [Jatrophihabitantaceae bacterium]